MPECTALTDFTKARAEIGREFDEALDRLRQWMALEDLAIRNYRSSNNPRVRMPTRSSIVVRISVRCLGDGIGERGQAGSTPTAVSDRRLPARNCDGVARVDPFVKAVPACAKRRHILTKPRVISNNTSRTSSERRCGDSQASRHPRSQCGAQLRAGLSAPSLGLGTPSRLACRTLLSRSPLRPRKSSCSPTLLGCT